MFRIEADRARFREIVRGRMHRSPVVVVSAMARVTDGLLAIARGDHHEADGMDRHQAARRQHGPLHALLPTGLHEGGQVGEVAEAGRVAGALRPDRQRRTHLGHDDADLAPHRAVNGVELAELHRVEVDLDDPHAPVRAATGIGYYDHMLEQLAKQIQIPVHLDKGAKDPVAVVKDGIEQARTQGRDAVILDTAGRLHVDEEMMEQLARVRAAAKPHNVLLVLDSMTGQDAVNVATAFSERIDFDGIVLTKLDGDARGGAALSVKAVTGKPIKLASTGEKLDQFEYFHPDRMASRILGMGDVLTLIERAEAAAEQDEQEALERRLRQGRFTFDEFLQAYKMMRRMGPMRNVISLIPGLGKQLQGVSVDDRELGRVEAIVLSMTAEERSRPEIIKGSRRLRIAPRVSLGLRQTITIELSPSIRFVDGTTLGQQYFWQFTTNSLRRPQSPMPMDGRQQESPVVLLRWGGLTESSAGPVSYEIHAGSDPASVSDPSGPALASVVAPPFLPRVAWRQDRPNYWAVHALNAATGERLVGPAWRFDTLPADAPYDSFPAAAIEWNWLVAGGRAQQCAGDSIVVAPNVVSAIRWDPGVPDPMVRLAAAAIEMTPRYPSAPATAGPTSGMPRRRRGGTTQGPCCPRRRRSCCGARWPAWPTPSADRNPRSSASIVSCPPHGPQGTSSRSRPCAPASPTRRRRSGTSRSRPRSTIRRSTRPISRPWP